MSREILSRMTTGEQFREIKVTLSGEVLGFEIT